MTQRVFAARMTATLFVIYLSVWALVWWPMVALSVGAVVFFRFVVMPWGVD